MFESRLEHGAHRYVSGGELKMALRNHVDDLLIAGKTVCPEADETLEGLQKFLHLERRDASFEHCGVRSKSANNGSTYPQRTP